MLTFDNVSSMTASLLSAGEQVRTLGYYTAGDIGAGYYTIKTPASVPSVDGYSDHVIANGNVAVLTLTGTIDVAQFGALGDDPLQDATPIIHAALAKGLTIRLHSKHTIKSSVNIPFNVTLLCDAGTELHGDASFVGNAGVYIGSKVVSQLGTLTSGVLMGGLELPISASVTTDDDSFVCVYDTTDYSWSAARSYYRAGEFCTAINGVGSTLHLDAPLYASYSAGVGVYKMNTGKFSVSGRLTVVTEGDRYCPPIFMQCISNCDVSNITAIAKDTRTALRLENCYRVTGSGLVGREHSSYIAQNYGLIVSNSQDCSFQGMFTGSRHGFTTGGGDYIGAVTNRGLNLEVVATTDGDGASYAFAFHGNTEYCNVSGTVRGGLSFAGHHNKFKGTVFGHQNGVILYHSEVKGWDLDYSGSTFVGVGADPALVSRGCIDLGGNGTAEVAGCVGGIINLSNCSVYAGNSTQGIKIVSRVANLGTRGVNLDNLHLSLSPATTVTDYAINITDALLTNIEQVSENGLVYRGDGSIRYLYVDNIINHPESGIEVVQVTTSNSIVSTVVPFSQKYTSGRDVSVVLTPQIQLGANLSGYARYINSSEFTLVIQTVDGSTFSADGDINVNWKAG